MTSTATSDCSIRKYSGRFQKYCKSQIRCSKTIRRTPSICLLRAGARLRLEQWDRRAGGRPDGCLAQGEAPPSFALVIRGSVRLMKKEYGKAENDFQRALRIDAKQTIARIGLARTHEAKGSLRHRTDRLRRRTRRCGNCLPGRGDSTRAVPLVARVEKNRRGAGRRFRLLEMRNLPAKPIQSAHWPQKLDAQRLSRSVGRTVLRNQTLPLETRRRASSVRHAANTRRTSSTWV